MANLLRVLIVEDSEDDAQIVLRQLRGGGYDPKWERVETAEAMHSALEREQWDVILCDYKMPRFDALAALKLVQEKELDVPFIIVSGTIGEETAVAAMKAGAHDYIMKDRLSKITITIDKEIREAGVRRDKKRADEALRESEKKFRELFENANEAIFVAQDERVVFANPMVTTLFGYSVAELSTALFIEFIYPDDRETVIDRHRRRLLGEALPSFYAFRVIRRDGDVRWVELSAVLIEWEGKPATLNFLSDITERKRAEEALQASEERYRLLADNASDVIMLMDMNARPVYFSPSVTRLLGYSVEEALEGSMEGRMTPASMEKTVKHFIIGLDREKREPGGSLGQTLELDMIHKNGSIVAVEMMVSFIRDAGGKPTGMMAILRDLTERKKAEAERIELSNALRATLDPVVILDMEGNVKNANEAARKLFEREDVGVNALETVAPEDRERVAAVLLDLMINERPAVAQFNVVTRSGRRIPVEASGSIMMDPSGKPVGIVVVERDLTERRQAEARQKLVAEILGILNEPMALPDGINRILTAIKRETGFYAVGIRLKKDEDFPYYVQNGFSEDFLLTENTLVVRSPDGGICRDKDGNVSLECTCGLVLSGKTDPSNPLFTAGGSAWTNDSIPLLDIPLDQDPRLHPRNRCIHAGFQSVALMPIHRGEEIVGLLQLNDRRKGCFTPEMIRFFEGIAASIGVALMRKRMEEALRESEEKYKNLFEHTLVGMEVIDGETGRVVLANRSMAKMFGFKSVADAVGINPMDYVLPEDREWVLRELSQVMADPEKHDVAILRARTEDGRIVWVSGSTTSFEYQGKPSALLSLVDVTAAREAEEALRESEEKYRGIFDESVAVVYLFDAKKRFIDTNQAGVDLLGYSREELLRMSIPDVDADPVVVLPAHQELLSGGRLINYEHRLRRKDGAIVTVLNNSRPLTDANDKIIGMLSTLIDITERKKAEEALIRISKAVESSSDAIGLSDAQGHHFYHNQAFTELFEYTAEELESVGGGPAAFENKNIARKVFDTIMSGGSWSGEVEMISKSGRKFLVLERADAIKDESGKVIGLVGVHTDITERKKAEEKLRETRDYMENLIEHANVPMVVWAPDFRITRFNRAFERLTGMKAKSMIGKNLEKLFPKETREKSMSYVRTAHRGARWEVVEIPIANVDGEVKTVLWNISTIYAEDRKTPSAIIAQGQDITERKKAEAALKESEEMARSMLDNAAIGIYLLQNKKFLYVNPTFEKIMGYTGAELVGQEAINYVHPEDRDVVRMKAVDNIKGTSTLPYEFRALRKDGRQIWVMERVTPIKYKGKRAVIASFMETTEHRKAEIELERAYEELKTAHDRMVQSEKLRAMGEMASGIAHDFNNMLAVILGRTQLVIDDVKDDKVKKGIQVIEQAALDAAKTVKRLQDFARIRVEHPFEPLDVNEVVEVVLRMVEPRVIELEQTKGIAIRVEQELGQVGQVSGDAAELREALLNILFNSMDAMPTGGKLTVKSWQEDDWVQITIKDTGVGIPDKVKSRVFEPFFTTKASKGSGLGLSVTYSIIARHGGMIKFDSAVGKGTTFYIRLPLAVEAVKKATKKGETVAAKPANILIVDDEIEVLKALGLTLEYFGHWVKEATSGAEAIKAFKEGKYDLVITDLGMPEMSGWDVARAIKKMKPEVPVLLITGWVIDLDEEQKTLVDGVVSKPFSRESISSAISQVFPAKKKRARKKKSE